MVSGLVESPLAPPFFQRGGLKDTNQTDAKIAMQDQENLIILIVDDNRNNLYTLRTLLEEHLEVTIVEAQSGLDALELLLEQNVDLIILDIQMPEMDGFETASLIRARRQTEHIPIVFLTAAYKSDDFKQKGFEIGAADYLTKPIDAPQLINRVKSYLRFIEQEKRHTRELKRQSQELAQTNSRLQAEVQEREQAQMDLHRISRQNQSILETAGEGIFGLDGEGRVRFINPAAATMLGFAQEELLGRRHHGIIHYAKPDGTPNPPQQCPICQALENGQAYHVDDQVFWRQNGSPFPVEYIVRPLHEEAKITGCVVTFRDITERKKAETALQQAKDTAEQASYAKSRFLANMSHELRTPLNAIIGYSEMLQEELEEDELADYTPDLKKIRAAGTHLLGLINDVLDISKIEAGKMDIYLEASDLNGLLHDVLVTAHPLLEKKNNVLNRQIPDELGVIYTDVTKLRQMLFNLISNASKFTKEGTITVSVTRIRNEQGDWIQFSVADTGIGMTAEQQDKVFEAFTQADTSTTRKYGGTGLGLAISKKFAEMLGGSLTLTSDFGHGSCFTILLPGNSEADYARHPPSAAVEPESDKKQRNHKGNVALVISAETETRDALYRFLATHGYIVGLAADGEEGLSLTHKLRPDVIILDDTSNGTPLREVLSKLHDSLVFEDIPVLCLGLQTPAGKRNDKAVEYLAKPLDYEHLQTVLKKYEVDLEAPLLMLVEDAYDVRKITTALFKKEGWRVFSCENGRIALEHLIDRDPALIVLDLNMPDMDGFEFLTHVRKSETWFTIPVIVTTGITLSEEERLRLKGQVAAIIPKGKVDTYKSILEKSKECLDGFCLKPSSIDFQEKI